MLIAGIRHQISAELDTHRSARFLRYLIHYLQMFAFLGVIIPIVIGVDYFSAPQSKYEIVTNKYSIIINEMNQIEYHFNTNSSYHFLSNIIFYENTNIQDRITLVCTPIFKTVTNVLNHSEREVYRCKPNSVYGWPLIIAGLTFICSIIYFIKAWGWIRKCKQIKYDSVINMGIINSLLCIFVIIAVFFQILN